MRVRHPTPGVRVEAVLHEEFVPEKITLRRNVKVHLVPSFVLQECLKYRLILRIGRDAGLYPRSFHNYSNSRMNLQNV